MGRGVSTWCDMSRVHTATLLGMLQFVVYQVVTTSQGMPDKKHSALLLGAQFALKTSSLNIV